MQLLPFLTPTTGYFDLFMHDLLLYTKHQVWTKHLIAGPLEYS